MRKSFVWIAFFLITQNSKAGTLCRIEKCLDHINNVSDTAVYPAEDLLKLSWPCYLDQPINILLKDLDRLFPNYILGKVHPGHRFLANGIHVYYGDEVVIVLTVGRFKFMNPSHKAKWEVRLFCKESLSNIELWRNDACLYKSGE